MKHAEVTFQVQPEIEHHGRTLHLHVLMEENIHALILYVAIFPIVTLHDTSWRNSWKFQLEISTRRSVI